MPKLLLLLPLLILCSCGEFKPVTGANEINIRDDMKATIAIQSDGKRLITIYRGGGEIYAIILLPAENTKVEAEKSQ
jgi:hypothetical protein